MFYFLQKHKLLQIIIVIILTVFTCIHLFSASINYSFFEPILPFSIALANGIGLHTGLFRGMILLTLLLEVFLLYNYFKKSAFTDNSTFFPVIWFLVFNAFACFLVPFTPIFLTNLAIIFLLNIHTSNSDSRLKMQILLSGALISLACFYDITAVFLLLFIVISLAINRLEKVRDVLVLLIGFLVPIIYVGAVYFFQGDFADFITVWRKLHFHPAIFAMKKISTVQIICLSVFALMIPYIVIQLKLLYDNKLIIIRKRFISQIVLFFTLLIMVLLTQVPLPYSLAYFSVPITFFLTSLIPEKKFSIVKELAIILFTASIIVMSMGL